MKNYKILGIYERIAKILSFCIFELLRKGSGLLVSEIRRFSDVNLDALLDVYSQSLGQKNWSEVNTFLEDLQLFFNNKNVRVIQWVEEGKAVAAMRLEPYQNGFLITCLETHPHYRRKGYALRLLESVMGSNPGVYYSHVDKRNKPSLQLHRKLGFETIFDYAVHVDGSVYSGSVTLRK